MKTNKRALWFWSTDTYAVEFNQPRIDPWHTAKECIAPVDSGNEYPYKPHDMHYDRRKDPAMIVLDMNNKLIERASKLRIRRTMRRAR